MYIDQYIDVKNDRMSTACICLLYHLFSTPVLAWTSTSICIHGYKEFRLYALRSSTLGRQNESIWRCFGCDEIDMPTGTKTSIFMCSTLDRSCLDIWLANVGNIWLQKLEHISCALHFVNRAYQGPGQYYGTIHTIFPGKDECTMIQFILWIAVINWMSYLDIPAISSNYSKNQIVHCTQIL